MKRHLYRSLLDWSDMPSRKPLLLKGARQVGKTHLLKKFGEERFSRCVYLNFEREPSARALFEGSLDPQSIIKNLQLWSPEKIDRDSLIFLDEIQECPAALNCLKYFSEEARNWPIAAAGSLLGVKLSPSGFPVGKVHILELFPMTFFEFLGALNENQWLEELQEKAQPEPWPMFLHDELLSLLKRYLYIGGMPEAVSAYLETGDLDVVRKIQEDIVDTYQLDFAKHASAYDSPKISRVWSSIPGQLARENKKFKYASLGRGARAREYQDALQWLIDAGIVHKCYHINRPSIPFASHCDRHIFKIYLHDVGLLGAMSRLPKQSLADDEEIFCSFKGALTENYVAQVLSCLQSDSLFYWTSSGTAEVDFVFQSALQAIPLEVKSGISKKKKSLRVFGDSYKVSPLSRATRMNLKRDDDIVNYPLYALELFPKFCT